MPARREHWTIWEEPIPTWARGKQALEYFNQALPIWREIGERSGEALTLNDMGPAYAGMGQKQKALEVYNQALKSGAKLGSRQGEALTLNFIGRLYRDLGQHQTALDYYNQALPIWREVGNRNGEALRAQRHRPRLCRSRASPARRWTTPTRRCRSFAKPGAGAAKP